MKHITITLLIVALLTACAPSQASIQTAIAQTQTVWTPVPTQTPYPTYTPLPTFTPLPTPTIVPTLDAPGMAQNVIAAFKNAGLEAENPYLMGPNDYGLAPYVCYGVRFLVPSLGPDNGGRIFICDDPAQQKTLVDYFNKLPTVSASLFSWVFVKGKVLVQINGDLPEATARQYEALIP